VCFPGPCQHLKGNWYFAVKSQMQINLDRYQTNRVTNVATRCPHCGHKGTFIQVGLTDVYTFIDPNNQQPHHFLGLRKCPNEKCNGHLFFIYDQPEDTLFTYPSETIQFEKEGIPQKVLYAFEEAIKCHSISCYMASAVMIRKTVEEICNDRDAQGANLFERIKKLCTKIVIPKELLEVMQDLRLLGNDAVHVELKSFDEIGKDEVEISMSFTKEILKATYQYEHLLKSFRSLQDKNQIKTESSELKEQQG